jgi:hypothetical protein
MMVRFLFLQFGAVAALGLLSGCAHNGASEEAAARQACEDQHTPAVEMDSCVEQMRNALEHARMPPPPPPQQHSPSPPR